MPRATFMWLLDTSMPFNRFLLTQLNERLGQFIGMVEHDRLLGPGRAARALPRVDVQSAPLSRASARRCRSRRRRSRSSRDSRASARTRRCSGLEQAGLLRIDYGGITVTNLPGLREFED